MTLWVVLILMVVAALAVVLFPQLRKRHRKLASRREYDVAVYADQLRELKTDVERGVLSADEETQARIEIERRVLHADAAQTIGGKKAGAPIFSAIGAGILLAFIPGFAVGIYLWQGSPDVAGQFAEIPPLPAAAPELGFAVEDMVARLRDAPDNLDGWLLLGRTYVTLGRHSEAVDAYRQAAALTPGDSSVHSRLGESMVMAAEGFVTPAARAIFEGALGVDGHDPAARYYLALANAQSGRLLEAFEGWRALARDAPADAPWLDDVRGRLAGLAGELGLDIDEAMEGVPAAPGTSQVARGPSQADIAAAAEMTPEERRTMIRGMVEGLAARLEENPNDPDGWLRLARSYDVLGESGRAAAARARAQTASAAPRGPGQDDIAAAAEMTPDERREMIRGMVEGLAARLEENPNDPTAGSAWLAPTTCWASPSAPPKPARGRKRLRPRRAGRARTTSTPPPKWRPRTATPSSVTWSRDWRRGCRRARTTPRAGCGWPARMMCWASPTWPARLWRRRPGTSATIPPSSPATPARWCSRPGPPRRCPRRQSSSTGGCSRSSRGTPMRSTSSASTMPSPGAPRPRSRRGASCC